MRQFFIIILLFSMQPNMNCSTTRTNFSVNDTSLYKYYITNKGKIISSIATVEFSNDTNSIFLEIFQKIKGAIIKKYDESLTIQQNSPYKLYKGKESQISFKNNILSLTIKTKEINFNEEMLVHDNTTEKEVNVYRNRAYMFDDRFKAIKILNDSLSNKPFISQHFDELIYKYEELHKIREDLTHYLFVPKYNEVRNIVINEIIQKLKLDTRK